MQIFKLRFANFTGSFLDDFIIVKFIGNFTRYMSNKDFFYVFSNMQQLVLFKFEYESEIKTVEENTFSSLKKLETLDLSKNLLR